MRTRRAAHPRQIQIPIPPERTPTRKPLHPGTSSESRCATGFFCCPGETRGHSRRNARRSSLRLTPMATLPASLSIDDVRAAALRLQGVAVRTPVLHSAELDALMRNVVVLKCENLQRAGAFKLRGAYNRMAQLSSEERGRGVVAFSSGNHAQGVALAARLLGMSATIVMPRDVSPLKLQATREFGADVVFYDRRTQDRELMAQQISNETHAIIVPPYDD